MSSRFGAQLRSLPKKCCDMLGVSVTIERSEIAGTSQLDSYSIDTGSVNLSPEGSFTANAIESPIDITRMPGDLINLEGRTYRMATEDCAFEPTNKNTVLRLNDGPEAGSVFEVVHVGRSAMGASRDITVAIAHGAGGTVSSGVET